MAQTIGRRVSTGATETPDFESDDQLLTLGNYVGTATADEEVFRLGFLAGASHNSSCPVSIALYDMSTAVSLTDPDGATLVAQGTISSPTGGQENTVDITPVALIEGRDYAVCFKVDDTPVGAAYFMRHNPGTQTATYRSDNPGSVAFDDPFAGTGTVGTWEYVVWAETQDTAVTPTIDDVNTDEEISNAETGNTITYSDFADLNGSFEISLRSNADASASVACTNVSLSGGTGTFDSFDIKTIGETPTAGPPLKTTNNQPELLLTETGNSESAVINVDLTVEAGYQAVEVLSASTAEGSLLETVTGAVVDQSILYGPTSDSVTIAPSGIVTTSKTTGSIDFWLWKKDAGTWEKIILLLSTPSTPSAGPVSQMKRAYFSSLSGSNGTVNECELAYYKQQLSVSEGSLPDLKLAFLKQELSVDSGNINDLLKAYYEAEPGVTGETLPDLENSFYSVKLGV